jgi:beta-phosphoglucomutase-like phosphatase (HAD superfamily)
MKYQGIIFDFNGVLWWDSYLQKQAWIRFTEELVGRSLSDDEIAHQVHGRNNRDTLEYLRGSVLDDEELKQLSDRKESIYRDLCVVQGAEFRLSPGAIGLLDSLVALQIPRTIATASGKENIDFFVKHLLLDRWFEIECIVYDDWIRPGKPAPDIYIQAAQMIGVDPHRCVVVEDSHAGIRSAHAAGIGYIIALGSIARHDHLLRQEGVDQAVETLAQVSWRRLFF